MILAAARRGRFRRLILVRRVLRNRPPTTAPESHRSRGNRRSKRYAVVARALGRNLQFLPRRLRRPDRPDYRRLATWLGFDPLQPGASGQDLLSAGSALWPSRSSPTARRRSSPACSWLLVGRPPDWDRPHTAGANIGFRLDRTSGGPAPPPGPPDQEPTSPFRRGSGAGGNSSPRARFATRFGWRELQSCKAWPAMRAARAYHVGRPPRSPTSMASNDPGPSLGWLAPAVDKSPGNASRRRTSSTAMARSDCHRCLSPPWRSSSLFLPPVAAALLGVYLLAVWPCAGSTGGAPPGRSTAIGYWCAPDGGGGGP